MGIRSRDLVVIQSISWIVLSLLLLSWLVSTLWMAVLTEQEDEGNDDDLARPQKLGIWGAMNMERTQREKWMWLLWLSTATSIISFVLAVGELCFACFRPLRQWVMRVRIVSRLLMGMAILDALVFLAETLNPISPNIHHTVVVARVTYFFACVLSILLLMIQTIWEILSVGYAREKEIEETGAHYTYLVE